MTKINTAILSFTHFKHAEIFKSIKSFKYMNKVINIEYALNPFKIEGKYINIKNNDTLGNMHIPKENVSEIIVSKEKYIPSFKKLCNFSIKISFE